MERIDMLFVKRTLFVVLIIAGIAFAALSILFFIASSANSSRVMTALIMAAAAIAAFVVSSVLKRNVDQNTPAFIDADVLRLASKYDGKLTAEMVVSNLYVNKGQAFESLDRLCSAGNCRAEMANDGQYYIFDSVKPKKMTRKCIYCGREQPLSQPITKCPYCGGEVRVVPKDS